MKQIIDEKFNGKATLGAKLFARSAIHNQQQASLPHQLRGPTNLLQKKLEMSNSLKMHDQVLRSMQKGYLGEQFAPNYGGGQEAYD